MKNDKVIYIIPKTDDKPIEIIDESVKLITDDNGDVFISRKMSALEIAELFDVPVLDILNGNVKFGMYTIEEGEEYEH